MKFFMSVALAASLAAGSASAATFNEIGDAGDSIATAQAVTVGTTSILGSSELGDDDMFALTYATDVLFEVSSITPITAQFADLFLFDGAGTELVSCLDCFFFHGGQATTVISLSIVAGTYYFLLNDRFDGTLGQYSFNVTETTGPSPVPLPASSLFLLSGLGLLMLRRRTKT